MHNAALVHLGLSATWRYQLLPVPPEAFGETVLALPQAGFAGANVTIPHKEAALALATTATGTARAIGAANTLTFDPVTGAVHADNTDAPGVLDALGGPDRVRGRTAVVLGAGGSARAVAWALRGAGAADVAVWNRSAGRAAALAADLGVRAVDRPHPADLLVNCTAVGLHGDARTFKDLPLAADDLREGAVVVDLVPRDGDTALLAAARERGCAVVDGLEVLVRQGARSLSAWLGRPAPLDVMRRAAREHLEPQARHAAPAPRPERA